ncbi:MAG TPA: hypothetical protein VGP04_21865, partial [Pseudonocardiaceae bacterium]|nr:hypothetical protein [Pseudonocardiaceae bacterium]
PWLTGNANTEHSELATAQREQPNNPGSANKGSKTGSQRDHTPRQGLDHRPTKAPDSGCLHPAI